MTASERDRAAWEAIRSWPAAAGVDPVQGGPDRALLTRWLLWDKVGRAIRREVDPEDFPFEARLLATAIPRATRAPSPARSGNGLRAVRGALLRGKLRAVRALGRKALLYAPFPHSRHARILEPLLATEAAFEVVVPHADAGAWPGAIPWGMKVPSVECHVATGEERVPRVEGRVLDGILKGLAAQGVRLLDADVETLRGQLREQRRTWSRAEAELDALRPDALLVPADNHPPFVEYVLAARQRGIPVIMLQHGLDCERDYLDDAYATHIAVWGPERERRYRRDSELQPERIAVVGNPHYDDVAPSPPAGDPNRWLWVTRPHSPTKCYAPSRRPQEGLRILDALLDGLSRIPRAQLVIKPHPFDYADEYRTHLAASGAERVNVTTNDTVTNLLAAAGVVITEDSTAGMDAMLAGRVLVHAHFAQSPPVMPFVKYGAALPGFSPQELADSLCRAVALGAAERAAMHAGQARFLDDFAGPRDRQAGPRFAAFVEEVVNRR